MTDWFERDETYTRTNTTKFIGSSSASVKYPFLTTQEHDMKFIFGRVYHMGKSMLDAMNFKNPYILKVSKNSTDSYTNGHKIMVSTNYFDDVDISLTQKLDVFLGLTIHEGLHCKYTDFTSKLPSTYTDTEKKLIHTLANIFEDERIEWLCGEEMPGYVNYLAKTKEYFFDTLYMKKTFLENSLVETTTANLLNIFVSCVGMGVRYPKHLTEAHVEYVGEYLLQVKQLLTPYPQSYAEVIVIAEKTFLLVKDFIMDVRNDCGMPTSEDRMTEIINTDSLTQEAIKKLSEAFQSNTINGPMSENDVPSSMLPKMAKGHDLEFQELDGCVELRDNNVVIHKSIPNAEKYADVYNSIKQYIPSVRTALTYTDKHQKLRHKSMFNGSLDTNKLVDSRCGVTNIYEKMGSVVTDKVAVCLLIDMSGSMDGNAILAAQKTAILLYESMKNNKSIEVYIYGHTADLSSKSTDIFVFFEPRMRTPLTLGSVDARDCNRDGLAILEVAKRVRQQTKKKCLMFVISDGNPNAHNYSGSPAIYDTKLKVEEVERTLNMDVVQIAIENEHEPDLMFSKFIKLTDIDNLPRDLNAFVKNTLMKNQQVTYS